MADTIRAAYWARELVEGTLATGMVNLPISKPGTLDNDQKRIIPEVHNGTRMMEQTTRRGIGMSKFNLTMPGYFDQLGYLFTSAFNADVAAAVASASGAFDHTFKAGGSSVPSASAQLFNGVDWWQALGCAIDGMVIKFEADKLPEITFNVVGQIATQISAPTPVAQSIAAYSQPWDLPQISVTLNGSAYAKLVSGTITIKNTRTPLYAIGSVSPVRFQEGPVKATIDLKALYTAYPGSIAQSYVNNTSIGALVITVTASDMIGTGTPVAVKSVLTIPAPLITTANLDDSKLNVEQSIKGSAGYASGSATVMSYLLRNEIGLTGYAGS